MSTPELEGTEQDRERWKKWDDLRERQANPDLSDAEREALAEEEAHLRMEGFAELLEQDAGNPQSWWWLSFTDGDLPEGEQFLGVSIVKARGLMEAILIAKIQGINPGGEVQGIEIPPEHVPDVQYRDRLLSRGEIEEAGL